MRKDKKQEEIEALYGLFRYNHSMISLLVQYCNELNLSVATMQAELLKAGIDFDTTELSKQFEETMKIADKLKAKESDYLHALNKDEDEK